MSGNTTTPNTKSIAIVVHDDISKDILRQVDHENFNLTLPEGQHSETPEERRQRIHGGLEAWCKDNLPKKAFSDGARSAYFELLFQIRLRWCLDMTDPDGPASVFFKERKSIIPQDVLVLFSHLTRKFERCWAGAFLLGLYQAWAQKTARVPKGLKYQVVLSTENVEEWLQDLGFDLPSQENYQGMAADLDIPFRLIPRKPFHVSTPKKPSSKKTVVKEKLPRRDSDLEAHVAGYRLAARDTQPQVDNEKAAECLPKPSGALGEELPSKEIDQQHHPNANQIEATPTSPGQALPAVVGGQSDMVMDTGEALPDASSQTKTVPDRTRGPSEPALGEQPAPKKVARELPNTKTPFPSTPPIQPKKAAENEDAFMKEIDDAYDEFLKSPSAASSPHEPGTLNCIKESGKAGDPLQIAIGMEGPLGGLSDSRDAAGKNRPTVGNDAHVTETTKGVEELWDPPTAKPSDMLINDPMTASDNALMDMFLVDNWRNMVE